MGRRSFTTEARAASPSTARYAHTYLSRIRPALGGQPDSEDLDTLDQLLADDRPGAVLRSPALTVRGARTAWAARRPAA